MMPSFLARGSADIRHNIAQECQVVISAVQKFLLLSVQARLAEPPSALPPSRIPMLEAFPVADVADLAEILSIPRRRQAMSSERTGRSECWHESRLPPVGA